MKKLLLLLSIVLTTGCILDLDYTIKKIGRGVSANLTITEKEAYNTYWKVSGIAVNEGNWSNDPISAPWYIEASFDTTTTDTTYLGIETKTINTSLGLGDTLYWEVYHYNNNLIESDYPDFAVKNLHAYFYGEVQTPY